MPPNRIGSDSDAALIDALAARLRSFERHAAGAMVRWIEETGITVVELRVFFVLADGEAMSGVQLAEAAGLTVESTYPAMHRLAARGWASERDRRHGLTALGREKVEEFAGARRAAVADFVASLPEGERRELAHAFAGNAERPGR